MKKFFIGLTGVYLLFLALIGILFGAINSLNLNSNPTLSTNERVQLLLMWLPLIGLLIATGIGLFRKKNWARYSIMVMSGFAIFMGFFGCLGFSFLPLPASEEVPVELIKLIIVTIFFLFLIVFPVIYLIFF